MSQTQQSFGADGPSNENEEGKVPSTFEEEEHSQKHSTALNKKFNQEQEVERQDLVQTCESLQNILLQSLERHFEEIAKNEKQISDLVKRISLIEETVQKLAPLNSGYIHELLSSNAQSEDLGSLVRTALENRNPLMMIIKETYNTYQASMTDYLSRQLKEFQKIKSRYMFDLPFPDSEKNPLRGIKMEDLIKTDLKKCKEGKN